MMVRLANVRMRSMLLLVPNPNPDPNQLLSTCSGIVFKQPAPSLTAPHTVQTSYDARPLSLPSAGLRDGQEAQVCPAQTA